MDYKLIQSIRILPSDKKTFNKEIDFRCFIEHTMVKRGGLYYFPQSMMTCPKNTLVLFQYDGMIRATGLLIDAAKKPMIDEKGEHYGGYYKFDVSTLHYLEKPLSGSVLKKAYPEFVSFGQAKKIIPMEYLDNILSVLQSLDLFYVDENKDIIRFIDSNIDGLGLQGKEVERLAKYRVNQSKFRSLLINRYRVCCLCGLSNMELLVASHIKPWRESNPTEKLDVNNGLLLCANHDALFDAGLISFLDAGTILISDSISASDKLLLNIKENLKIEIRQENKPYLDYHRRNVFKK